ncbi:MAG: MCE family protein [Aeromicrobium sp.]|uniref:MCE family protein n=1 Tax=Aeromicrobium sp. TaxID=1871063 RepID=UPI0039E2162D
MSSVGLAQRIAGASKIFTVFVLLALFAAAVLVFNRGSDAKTLTADFSQTTSLYVGSEVRMLGVPVGTVTKLEPKGEVVRATIEYEADIDLPKDVKAAIISPAIVGDRFVQLAPVYTGGAKLADDAHLTQESTAVPVELDQIYQSLDDLAVALGPNGANSQGALSDLLSETATQLDGQGAQLNETLKNFGQFTSTLSDNSDELFSGVSQVEEFVSMLQANDQAVRSFNDNTADVAAVLADERDDLAATLTALTTALTSVESLVQDNRGTLRQNVSNLKSLAEVLAARQDELGAFASAGPTALSNVVLAYNPGYGTLDTHANLEGTVLQLLTGTGGAGRLLCALVGQPVDGDDALCELATGLFGSLSLPTTSSDTSASEASGTEEAASATDPTQLAELLTGGMP